MSKINNMSIDWNKKYLKNKIYLDKKIKIDISTKIFPNNFIIGSTKIGINCIFLPNNFLQNCTIKNNVTIHNSVLSDCEVGVGCKIGVFSHLRDGVKLGKNCKIGNFCEIKNSTLGDGCKMSHLAYVGDSEIGKNCNIGCGVVFANYDGTKKQKIIVGDNVFIGSNSILIAPLNIADGTYICAGSVVTENTNVNDFVIGRVKAVHKANKAIGRYCPTAHQNQKSQNECIVS